MWAELEEALATGRPRDALRLAVPLWRTTRDSGLADLIEALAAFVDSDPRTAPDEPPKDPADLDGWLAAHDHRAQHVFVGAWWTREWLGELHALLQRFETLDDDPRVATAMMDFILVPHHARYIGHELPRFFARLIALRDERARTRLVAFQALADVGGRYPREYLTTAIAELKPEPALGEREADIVARGLARYRDEPQRLIALILDPTRPRDDGTEQVAADALTELGHPYGEAIALEYDQAAGIISSDGRKRLTTLIACHERRWLGRDLFVSTSDRVYRGGLLDEMVLRVGRAQQLDEPRTYRPEALPPAKRTDLGDPRLARLRVLRAESVDWDEREAESIRESPWLRALEELDAPTFEFLAAATKLALPNLRKIRLELLRPLRVQAEWSSWAEALAAWLDVLPSLKEVFFRSIPDDGPEILIEALVASKLHERVETFSLDCTRGSWIRRRENDPSKWFHLLDRHGVRRAALHYTDAIGTLEWTPSGLVFTLETSEGGAAFDLFGYLPKRPIARLVFRDLPGKRPKKLANLGRLRRYLESLGAVELDLPVRWKNQLSAAR